jgi:hypothetical protein
MYTQQEYELIAVPVPPSTSSYSPVPHKLLIDGINEVMDLSGMQMTSRKYNSASGGDELTATFTLLPKGKLGANMQACVMMQNSYNKRIALRVAFGTSFSDSDTVMMNNPGIFLKRMHTGNIKDEVEKLLREAVEYVNFDFQKINEMSLYMRDFQMGPSYTSKMVGELVLHEDIITMNMLGNMRGILSATYKKMIKDGNKPVISLWDFYRLLENNLRNSKTSKQVEYYMKAFSYFKNKFGF